MNYYFISFWMGKDEYSNGVQMPPQLVKADTLQAACDKLCRAYPDLYLWSFNNLTIE